MSAVPKKKLCWNCDGNVARDLDNCPYCGVYVHATEPESSSFWGPSYRPTDDEEESEIPEPPYRSQDEKITTVEQAEFKQENAGAAVSFPLWPALKNDILPIAFLMSGSVFFLFGIVLFLFSQNGVLTLQWNGDNWLYFLGCSIPFFLLGQKYFRQMN